jgi:hypothetical protein
MKREGAITWPAGYVRRPVTLDLMLLVRLSPALAAVAIGFAVAGCAESAGVTPLPSAGATAGPGHDRRTRIDRHRHRSRHRPTATHARSPSPAATLAVSRASSGVVQTQPAAGTCHARGSGLYSGPDPSCTPGALNPAVTQSTIDHTICVSGWTETVRPSERVTDEEKIASMAAYGDGDSTSSYEYDHLVSLELGGALNDARNLWPEPGASPNPKDTVEDQLHRMVCDGQMRLARAQHIIATGWVSRAKRNRAASPSPTSTHGAPTSASGPDKPVADVTHSAEGRIARPTRRSAHSSRR